MRIAITLAYNGKEFFGSQIQKETSQTVLGTFEKVLQKLGINTKVIASGRTDRGVHASAQVVHVDLPHYWNDLHKLKRVLNTMLPTSLHVRSIKQVSQTFHARYDATARVYRYLIKVGESNPFEADFITFVSQCDFDKIAKNIKLFEGVHDFSYFLKTGSDEKSPIREIYKAFAYRYKGIIVLHFKANGFLRSQIRFMVASLLHLDAFEIQKKLTCKHNYKIKPAPPNGLYLAKIHYKKDKDV